MIIQLAILVILLIISWQIYRLHRYYKSVVEQDMEKIEQMMKPQVTMVRLEDLVKSGQQGGTGYPWEVKH